MSDREPFREARDAGLKARHETRVERAREREAETLKAEVEPWLQECGSCDYALAMGCTCPPGDYRVILLKVWQAYQRATKEAAPTPPKCPRCHGYGYIPDFTNWDDYHGEPKPKPCPDCSEATP